MLKRTLFFLWLLAPVLLLAFHLGPGQTGMARDEAARRVALAAKLVKSEDWPGATAAYSEALARLPTTDRALRWSLRLALAKARMRSGELPEAMGDLDVLLAEIQRLEPASPTIQDIRANIATAEYYAAWLMRLEGAVEEDWMTEVESAREQFGAFAKEKSNGENPAAKEYGENLEAAIRLSRMELSDLRKLPLPKFLQNCKNVGLKCRARRSKPNPPTTPTPGANASSTKKNVCGVAFSSALDHPSRFRHGISCHLI